MWCAVQKMATENLQLARRLARPHPCLSTEESHPDSVACASRATYRSCSRCCSQHTTQQPKKVVQQLYISFHMFALFSRQFLRHIVDIYRWGTCCLQSEMSPKFVSLLFTLNTIHTLLWQVNCWSMTDNDARISSGSSKNLPSSCVLNKEYFIGTAPCSELLD